MERPPNDTSQNRYFLDKKYKMYQNNTGKQARLVINLYAQGLKFY